MADRPDGAVDVVRVESDNVHDVQHGSESNSSTSVRLDLATIAREAAVLPPSPPLNTPQAVVQQLQNVVADKGASPAPPSLSSIPDVVSSNPKEFAPKPAEPLVYSVSPVQAVREGTASGSPAVPLASIAMPVDQTGNNEQVKNTYVSPHLSSMPDIRFPAQAGPQPANSEIVYSSPLPLSTVPQDTVRKNLGGTVLPAPEIAPVFVPPEGQHLSDFPALARPNQTRADAPKQDLMYQFIPVAPAPPPKAAGTDLLWPKLPVPLPESAPQVPSERLLFQAVPLDPRLVAKPDAAPSDLLSPGRPQPVLPDVLPAPASPSMYPLPRLDAGQPPAPAVVRLLSDQPDISPPSRTQQVQPVVPLTFQVAPLNAGTVVRSASVPDALPPSRPLAAKADVTSAPTTPAVRPLLADLPDVAPPVRTQGIQPAVPVPPDRLVLQVSPLDAGAATRSASVPNALTPGRPEAPITDVGSASNVPAAKPLLAEFPDIAPPGRPQPAQPGVPTAPDRLVFQVAPLDAGTPTKPASAADVPSSVRPAAHIADVPIAASGTGARLLSDQPDIQPPGRPQPNQPGVPTAPDRLVFQVAPLDAGTPTKPGSASEPVRPAASIADVPTAPNGTGARLLSDQPDIQPPGRPQPAQPGVPTAPDRLIFQVAPLDSASGTRSPSGQSDVVTPGRAQPGPTDVPSATSAAPRLLSDQPDIPAPNRTQSTRGDAVTPASSADAVSNKATPVDANAATNKVSTQPDITAPNRGQPVQSEGTPNLVGAGLTNKGVPLDASPTTKQVSNQPDIVVPGKGQLVQGDGTAHPTDGPLTFQIIPLNLSPPSKAGSNQPDLSVPGKAPSIQPDAIPPAVRTPHDGLAVLNPQPIQGENTAPGGPRHSHLTPLGADIPGAKPDAGSTKVPDSGLPPWIRSTGEGPSEGNSSAQALRQLIDRFTSAEGSGTKSPGITMTESGVSRVAPIAVPGIVINPNGVSTSGDDATGSRVGTVAGPLPNIAQIRTDAPGVNVQIGNPVSGGTITDTRTEAGPRAALDGTVGSGGKAQGEPIKSPQDKSTPDRVTPEKIAPDKVTSDAVGETRVPSSTVISGDGRGIGIVVGISTPLDPHVPTGRTGSDEPLPPAAEPTTGAIRVPGAKGGEWVPPTDSGEPSETTKTKKTKRTHEGTGQLDEEDGEIAAPVVKTVGSGTAGISTQGANNQNNVDPASDPSSGLPQNPQQPDPNSSSTTTDPQNQQTDPNNSVPSIDPLNQDNNAQSPPAMVPPPLQIVDDSQPQSCIPILRQDDPTSVVDPFVSQIPSTTQETGDEQVPAQAVASFQTEEVAPPLNSAGRCDDSSLTNVTPTAGTDSVTTSIPPRYDDEPITSSSTSHAPRHTGNQTDHSAIKEIVRVFGATPYTTPPKPDRKVDDQEASTFEMLNFERWRSYKVKRGDTLQSIAVKELGNAKLISLVMELNRGLLAFDRNGKVKLKPGTIIRLPSRAQILRYLAQLERHDSPLFDFADNAAQYHVVYVCRLGDTVKTIAKRHPAIRDARMWPLIARVNRLPEHENDQGEPAAKLNRGDRIILPSIEERREYLKLLVCGTTSESPHGMYEPTTDSFLLPETKSRASADQTHACAAQSNQTVPTSRSNGGAERTDDTVAAGRSNDVTERTGETVSTEQARMQGNPNEAVTAPSKNAGAAPRFLDATPSTQGQFASRLVTQPDLGEGSQKLTLALQIELGDCWATVIEYSIDSDAPSSLTLYTNVGRQKQIAIDLPTRAARELAENDLAANCATYCEHFMSDRMPF